MVASQASTVLNSCHRLTQLIFTRPGETVSVTLNFKAGGKGGPVTEARALAGLSALFTQACLQSPHRAIMKKEQRLSGLTLWFLNLPLSLPVT